MKKIVYFLQTHKNKRQIVRLVYTLKKYVPNSLIIVGHDSVDFMLKKEDFLGLKNIEIFHVKYRVARGSFAFCQVLIDAMRWLFENNINFDWLINISGQDYPVKNPQKIEEFLSKTQFDAFTCYWSFDSEKGRDEQKRLLERYYAQYVFFPRPLKFLYRLIAFVYTRIPRRLRFIHLHFFPEYGRALGVSVKKTPFTEKFVLYRGYAWHYLSHQCCAYVLDFVKNNPLVIKYFGKTLVSDESFFQTVLLNAKKFNVCDDYRRYVDLDNRPKGHPLIITVDDFKCITQDKYDFSRKFDIEVDARVLDELDVFLGEERNGD